LGLQRHARPQRVLQLVTAYFSQKRSCADPQNVGGPLPIAAGFEKALLNCLTL
jgi:hypothetical protein